MLLVTSSVAKSLASSNSDAGMSKRSSARRTPETLSGLASSRRSSRGTLSIPKASPRSAIWRLLPLEPGDLHSRRDAHLASATRVRLGQIRPRRTAWPLHPSGRNRGGCLESPLAEVGLERLVVGLIDEVGLATPLVAECGQEPGQTLPEIGEVHSGVTLSL